MREINEIIVHCSATRPDWMEGRTTLEKVYEIACWHVVERKWRAIGYHRLIDRDGTLANGRPIAQVGAHVKGHNAKSIGVCLLGGHGSAKTDKFEDHFTPEQEDTLLKLIGEFQETFGPNLAVTGHNNYANKACPGFDVHEFMADRIVRPGIIDTPVAPPVEKEKETFWQALASIFSALFKR